MVSLALLAVSGKLISSWGEGASPEAETTAPVRAPPATGNVYGGRSEHGGYLGGARCSRHQWRFPVGGGLHAGLGRRGGVPSMLWPRRLLLFKAWREWRTHTYTYEMAPGEARSAWETQRIDATRFPTSVRSWPRLILGGVVSWGAALLAGGLLVWPRIQGGGEVTLIVIALTGPIWAVAVYMAYKLYKGMRNRRHYERCTFVMDQWPAVLGGTVSGTLETGARLSDRPSDGFAVALTCYKRRPNQQGRKPRYESLWSAETKKTDHLGPDGEVHVPITFELPEGLPPATLECTGTRMLWRLDVSAVQPSPPYEQSIELPVYPSQGRTEGTGRGDWGLAVREWSSSALVGNGPA